MKRVALGALAALLLAGCGLGNGTAGDGLGTSLQSENSGAGSSCSQKSLGGASSCQGDVDWKVAAVANTDPDGSRNEYRVGVVVSVTADVAWTFPTRVRSRGTGLAAGATKFGGVLILATVAAAIAAPSIRSTAVIGAIPLVLAISSLLGLVLAGEDTPDQERSALPSTVTGLPAPTRRPDASGGPGGSATRGTNPAPVNGSQPSGTRRGFRRALRRSATLVRSG